MIRTIRSDELEELLELYGDMHIRDNPIPDEKRLESVWSEIMADDKISYFVVEIGSVLVSCCHLVIVPNLTRGLRPYAIIENVVTRESYRNKGYGKAVVKYAVDFAWQRKCYKVMLLTGRQNETVFRFYESLGFNRHSKQAFIIKP